MTALVDPAQMRLFRACFVALVATSFVFGVRASSIGQLGNELNLSQTEVGTILGVGLWPFALSIVLFSLIIDRIGYKVAAGCAFTCHIIALIVTLAEPSYNTLFWGTFIMSIGNGIVEAFINPVVATAFNTQKAKWLNILHAGWPLGLALGALFATAINGLGLGWQAQYAVCFLPILAYGAMIIPCHFPPNERAAAGISYKEMLGQVGAIGFFIIGGFATLAVMQLYVILSGTNIEPFQLMWTSALVALGIAVAAGAYARSWGHWMFILILITMGPLATTELGTDGWMEVLLSAELPKLAVWIFIMISLIMTVLRFYAGPIIHAVSPIGLLVCSAVLAIGGLLALWQATGYVLIAAAILYAFGKTFLWSTTLGMVSEQFPKGGALTLNGVSAVGCLGMGLLGATLMGNFIDKGVDHDLRTAHPAIHERIVGEPRVTFLGQAPTIKQEVVNQLPAEEKQHVEQIKAQQKKQAFLRQAALPAFMLLCYLIIFFYFRRLGGYRPQDIAA